MFVQLAAFLFVLAVLARAILAATSNFGAIQVSDGYAAATSLLPGSASQFVTFLAGAQTTGTEKSGFISPYAGTIVDVRAYLTTVPTVSTFIVDLMKNGVTMFTTTANRPAIAISGNASTTLLPDIVAVAVGDRLRVDVIQIGSGVAGSNLYVTVTTRVASLA